MHIFKYLNKNQTDAVTIGQGPVLVLAGPGTGKTKTIVHRIAWLADRGTPPENIAAVTFTNRAAREMKERAEALIGKKAKQAFIGTFHLLGLRILSERGNSDFVIFSREEQVELLKSLMKSSARKAREALDEISRVKNCLETPGDDLGQLIEAYQSELARANALDFDDLIRVPLDLLQDAATRKIYRDRFKHLIVDEYQDINPAQERLLRLLSGDNPNLFAVGDPDQAIYSFRGADLRNFLNFERDFPGATRVTLVQNYRSARRIVRAAESVIKNNENRIAKEVVATRPEGGPVREVSLPDDRGEGAAIIQEIEARIGGTSHFQLRRLDRGEGFAGSYRFSDFAVIYRTNAQAKALEDAFIASGIPYQVIGKRSSAQQKDIEETIAFLHTLAQPGFERGAPGDNRNSVEMKLLSEADFFDPGADAVTLMTMHMAKGLEFRVVFIAGCEEGLVPCTLMNDGPDIEEERRLFYVGMTRAREELILTRSRSRFLHGQRLAPKCSPFVNEIPDHLKEAVEIGERIKKQMPEEKQMGLF